MGFKFGSLIVLATISVQYNIAMFNLRHKRHNFDSIFKISKFEFFDNENETGFDENSTLGNEAKLDETFLNGFKTLNFGDLLKSLGYDPGSLIKASHTGDVATLRRLRSFVRRSVAPIVSPGCVGDLLFFVDHLIEYSMARYDLTGRCAAVNSTMDAIDCDCTAKVEKSLDESKWAIDALDSYGKLSPGLFNANLFMLGEYEQCTEISVSRSAVSKDENNLQGQYCRIDLMLFEKELFVNVSSIFDDIDQDFLANLDNGEGFLLNKLANSNSQGCNSAFSYKIGTCFPRSCSRVDVQALVGFVINLPQKAVGKQAICSTNVLCHEELDIRNDWGALIVMAILVTAVTLLVFGTSYDYYVCQDVVKENNAKYKKDEQMNVQPSNVGKHSQHSTFIKIILAFSVYTNGKQLFSTKRVPGQIDCLHGVRALSMSWIVLGHTYYWSVNYLNNPFAFFSLANRIWNQVILNSSISVDAFYLLSGSLLAYLWLNHTRKTKGRHVWSGMRWLMFYIHRYLRLTPVYAFFLAIDIFLVRYITDGPMWNQKGVEPNFCANSWWINMLYMNNFFSLKEQCMTWTWYLANDMQFYMLTPPILLLLWNFRIFGLILIGILLLVTSLIRMFIVVWTPDYPPISLVINDMSKMHIVEDFWADVYIKPYCRCGSYLVGLLLGYLLHRVNLKLSLPKWAHAVGWASMFATFGGLLFGLHDLSETGQISLAGKAIYAAVGRPLWCIALAWLILMCATGHGGFINKFLSASFWFPISRLVYCTYLVHPIIIIVFYSSHMKTIHLDPHYGVILYFFANLVTAFLCAAVLHLTFEMPAANLEKLLFTQWPMNKPSVNLNTQKLPLLVENEEKNRTEPHTSDTHKKKILDVHT